MLCPAIIHNKDFCITASWSFLVKSQVKITFWCNRNTIKLLIAKASLQRPYNNQVPTPSSMLQFFKENISVITSIFIPYCKIEFVYDKIEEISADAKSIPGMKSYHQFDEKWETLRDERWETFN